MLKKILLIGLVCIGITAFMPSQASAGCCCNPRFCASWLGKGVEGDLNVYGDPNELVGKTVLMRVFTTDDTDPVELAGTVFCAPDPGPWWVLKRNIKECRRQASGGGGHWWWWWWWHRGECESGPGAIPYDNSEPLVASDEFTEQDCDEEFCMKTLTIEFNDGEEQLDGRGQALCDFLYEPDGSTKYVDFIPNEPANEGIVVGVENIENCPDILPDLLVADDCDLNVGGSFDCEPIPLEDLGNIIPDYPGGYGGYGGYGGFDVCNEF